MIFENNKYIITCNEIIEENLFNEFCTKFENEFKNINSFFNIKYKKLNINLLSRENFNSIVKAKSEQYKNIDIPSWLVGFSTFSEVFVIMPTIETLDELYKVALHETVHLISYQLDTSNKRIKLLDEGLAVFLSNQYEGKRFTPWVNAYLQNVLPKIIDFCTYDSIEFANKKGYQFSYYIIDFLINTYGKSQFLNWLQNPHIFLEKIDKININFETYIITKIEARIK